MVTSRGRNIQPGQVNTNSTTSPSPEGYKKRIASKVRLYPVRGCNLRNSCSNIAAVRQECYLVAHGFTVLSIVNGHTHQSPVSWGHWAWAWR